MQIYKFVIIILLLANFSLTLLLYQLYFSVLALSYENLLVMRSIMRNYDIFCSILNTKSPILNFWNTFNAFSFFQNHKLLPVRNWRFDYGVKLESDEKFPVSGIDWYGQAHDLVYTNLDLFFRLGWLRSSYDFLANLLYDVLGVYFTPFAFSVLLVIVLVVLVLWLMFYDPAALLVSEHHYRLFQLENFVTQKLNEGKPVNFRSRNWNPIAEVRRTEPEFFSDRFFEDWLASKRPQSAPPGKKS